MLKRILGTLVLGLSLVVVVPMSSASAVSCSGNSCTGKDPETTGCAADATTVSTFTAHYGNNFGLDPYLELRQSNRCKTRWVRVKSGPSDWGCGGGSQPQLRIRNLNSRGGQIAAYITNFPACGPFPKWTPMVYHTASSSKVEFGFREAGYNWCSDSFYNPCKTKAW